MSRTRRSGHTSKSFGAAHSRASFGTIRDIMTETEQLTVELKQEARALGFDLVAVARAEPPPHAEALDAWLAAGYAGEMAYLARNAAKRQTPGLVVEGARSIVVAGVHYRSAEPDPAA